MYDKVNNAPAGFFSLTDSGNIVEANETFSTMLEYEKDELLTLHIESLMSISNKFFFHTYFFPYISLYGTVDEMYINLKTKSGNDLPILLFGKSFKKDGNDCILCVCVHIPKRLAYEKELRLISTKVEKAYREKDEIVAKLNRVVEENDRKNLELTELNNRLERLVTIDTLTGLYNRQYFASSLTSAIENYYIDAIHFSLAMIDVDFFKAVNDTWGHLIGDQVLIQLAQVINSVFDKDTVNARFGGEEFIILLSGMGKEESLIVSEKLRSVVENTDFGKCLITVSVGVSTYSGNETAQTLLTYADNALYKSKGRGRNCVTHSGEI